MKQIIKRIPLFGPLAIFINNKINPPEKFTNSSEYWKKRYDKGGNSGAGSYNNLAEFKGEILNKFANENKINTVIELGCGDGNQVDYFQFKSYIGFDISTTVIEKCKLKFKGDSSRQFMHMDSISNQKADLLISLDVIYHLVEDQVYYNYMNKLFDLSKRYVIIYSFDSNISKNYAPHVKPRKFTAWIKQNKPNFQLVKHIPNRYPINEKELNNTSFADFYIYTN